MHGIRSLKQLKPAEHAQQAPPRSGGVLLRVSLMVAALNLFGGASPSLAASSDDAQKTQLATIRAAALHARDTCFKQIHFDMVEFEDCIKALSVPKKTDAAQRLGYAYFGFVGALSANRGGTLGAMPMAWDFARTSRSLQKKLAIDDAALCSTIEGDCDIRRAIQSQLLSSPRPPAATASQLAESARHH